MGPKFAAHLSERLFKNGSAEVYHSVEGGANLAFGRIHPQVSQIFMPIFKHLLPNGKLCHLERSERSQSGIQCSTRECLDSHFNSYYAAEGYISQAYQSWHDTTILSN